MNLLSEYQGSLQTSNRCADTRACFKTLKKSVRLKRVNKEAKK
jgi:hypothetical protein